MFSKRVYFRWLTAASFLFIASCSQAENTDMPPVVKALEEQGLVVKNEFQVEGEMRAFASVAGDRPIAVYVLADGKAIVGTRLNAKAEPMDEQTLQSLVAQPISDQSWAELESSNWVLDGNADAKRVVYVFTDANCPYCHQFWTASRPWVDAGKVQLRHLLVGIIKEDSPAKAAAILGAPDPSAALRENEIKYDQGGIKPADGVPENVQKILDDNQRLMLSQGFRGTPGIVVRNENGLIKKYGGMPQQGELAEVMGPR